MEREGRPGARSEAWTGPSRRPRREHSPAGPLISGFRPPELETVNFCRFSHPVCGITLGQVERRGAANYRGPSSVCV